MNLVEFLQNITDIINTFAESESSAEKSVYSDKASDVIRSYVRNERDFEGKCKALTQSLQFYAAVRPLCDLGDHKADNLGQSIFMECARLVLGTDFQQSGDSSGVKASFLGAVTETFVSLRHYFIGQVFLVLQWLVTNGWNRPALCAMMAGEEIKEEIALSYLSSAEFPELIRLRLEILMEQQCEDLALNLCAWCARSPVFARDATVRGMHLWLLYKHGREDFHDRCLDVPCCLLVEILTALETDPDAAGASLMICQTALLQDWLHPDPDKSCCTETLLRCFLQLEKNQSQSGEQFLNSANKILQLSINADQRRLLLKTMVDMFGQEHIQFCSEVGLAMLKKDRFALDASKIRRDESEADAATRDVTQTCRILARLFEPHEAMSLACLLTVFYLDPDDTLFRAVRDRLDITASAAPARGGRASGCIPLDEPPLLCPPGLGSNSAATPDLDPGTDPPGRLSAATEHLAGMGLNPVSLTGLGLGSGAAVDLGSNTEPPAGLDPDVYRELHCVVDMLRPAPFHPSRGWEDLKLILILHMLESGFVYNHEKNRFTKVPVKTRVLDNRVQVSPVKSLSTVNTPQSSPENSPAKAGIIALKKLDSDATGKNRATTEKMDFMLKLNLSSAFDGAVRYVEGGGSVTEGGVTGEASNLPKMDCELSRSRLDNRKSDICRQNGIKSGNDLTAMKCDDRVQSKTTGQENDKSFETIRTENSTFGTKIVESGVFGEEKEIRNIRSDKNDTSLEEMELSDVTERTLGDSLMVATQPLPEISLDTIQQVLDTGGSHLECKQKSEVPLSLSSNNGAQISECDQPVCVHNEDRFSESDVRPECVSDIGESDLQSHQVVRAHESDLQPDPVVSAIENDLQSDHFVRAHESDLQSDPIVRANKNDLQSDQVVRAHESDLQPDPVVRAIENDLQSDHFVRAHESDLQSDPIVRANENDLQSDPIVRANENDLQSDQIVRAHESDLQLDQVVRANESDLQSDPIVHANENDLQSDHFVRAHESDLQSDPIVRANKNDLQSDQVVRAHESDLQPDPVVRAIENDLQSDHFVRAHESDLQSDPIVRANENDLQSDPIVRANENDLQSDQIVRAHESDLQLDQVVRANESDLQSDPIVHANENDLQSDQIVRAHESDLQLDQVVRANENDRQTDQIVRANESEPQPDRLVASAKSDPYQERSAVSAESGLHQERLGVSAESGLHQERLTADNENGEQRTISESKLRRSANRTAIRDSLSALSISRQLCLGRAIEKQIVELLTRKDLGDNMAALSAPSKASFRQILSKLDAAGVKTEDAKKLRKLVAVERMLRRLRKRKIPEARDENEAVMPQQNDAGDRTELGGSTSEKTGEQLLDIAAGNVSDGQSAAAVSWEVQFGEGSLRCTFCDKRYESVILRRRHEEFFCVKKTDHASIEKSSTEILTHKSPMKSPSGQGQMSPDQSQVMREVPVNSRRPPVRRGQGRSAPRQGHTKWERQREKENAVGAEYVAARCAYCGLQYDNPEARNRHCFVCTMRRDARRKEKLQQARLSLRKDDYRPLITRKCRFCRKLYGHLPQLRRHEKWCAQQPVQNEAESNESDGSLCICKYCQRIFDTRRNLNVHVVQCHPETYDDVSDVSDVSEDASDSDVSDGDDTGVSGDNDNGDIDVEMFEEAGSLDQTINQSVNKSIAKNEFELFATTKSSWPCLECKKRCTTVSALCSHIRLHHSTVDAPFEYICLMCPRTVVGVAAFMTHCEEAHGVPYSSCRLDQVKVTIRNPRYRLHLQPVLEKLQGIHAEYSEESRVGYSNEYSVSGRADSKLVRRGSARKMADSRRNLANTGVRKPTSNKYEVCIRDVLGKVVHRHRNELMGARKVSQSLLREKVKAYLVQQLRTKNSPNADGCDPVANADCGVTWAAEDGPQHVDSIGSEVGNGAGSGESFEQGIPQSYLEGGAVSTASIAGTARAQKSKPAPILSQPLPKTNDYVDLRDYIVKSPDGGAGRKPPGIQNTIDKLRQSIQRSMRNTHPVSTPVRISGQRIAVEGTDAVGVVRHQNAPLPTLLSGASNCAVLKAAPGVMASSVAAANPAVMGATAAVAGVDTPRYVVLLTGATMNISQHMTTPQEVQTAAETTETSEIKMLAQAKIAAQPNVTGNTSVVQTVRDLAAQTNMVSQSKMAVKGTGGANELLKFRVTLCDEKQQKVRASKDGVVGYSKQLLAVPTAAGVRMPNNSAVRMNLNATARRDAGRPASYGRHRAGNVHPTSGVTSSGYRRDIVGHTAKLLTSQSENIRMNQTATSPTKQTAYVIAPYPIKSVPPVTKATLLQRQLLEIKRQGSGQLATGHGRFANTGSALGNRGEEVFIDLTEEVGQSVQAKQVVGQSVQAQRAVDQSMQAKQVMKQSERSEQVVGQSNQTAQIVYPPGRGRNGAYNSQASGDLNMLSGVTTPGQHVNNSLTTPGQHVNNNLTTPEQHVNNSLTTPGQHVNNNRVTLEQRNSLTTTKENGLSSETLGYGKTGEIIANGSANNAVISIDNYSTTEYLDGVIRADRKPGFGGGRGKTTISGPVTDSFETSTHTLRRGELCGGLGNPELRRDSKPLSVLASPGRVKVISNQVKVAMPLGSPTIGSFGEGQSSNPVDSGTMILTVPGCKAHNENEGDYNQEHENEGDYNQEHENEGDYNQEHENEGDYNQEHENEGDYNQERVPIDSELLVPSPRDQCFQSPNSVRNRQEQVSKMTTYVTGRQCDSLRSPPNVRYEQLRVLTSPSLGKTDAAKKLISLNGDKHVEPNNTDSSIMRDNRGIAASPQVPGSNAQDNALIVACPSSAVTKSYKHSGANNATASSATVVRGDKKTDVSAVMKGEMNLVTASGVHSNPGAANRAIKCRVFAVPESRAVGAESVRTVSLADCPRALPRGTGETTAPAGRGVESREGVGKCAGGNVRNGTTLRASTVHPGTVQRRGTVYGDSTRRGGTVHSVSTLRGVSVGNTIHTDSSVFSINTLRRTSKSMSEAPTARDVGRVLGNVDEIRCAPLCVNKNVSNSMNELTPAPLVVKVNGGGGRSSAVNQTAVGSFERKQEGGANKPNTRPAVPRDFEASFLDFISKPKT